MKDKDKLIMKTNLFMCMSNPIKTCQQLTKSCLSSFSFEIQLRNTS